MTNQECKSSIGVLSYVETIDFQLFDPSDYDRESIFVQLPNTLNTIIPVRILEYKSNEFDIKWDQLIQFSCIQVLFLDENEIWEIPASIVNLNYLKTLSVGQKNLIAIPENIDQLAYLTGLYLQENDITSLPTSIGNMKGLQSLNLESNQLISLPDTLSNLVKLRHFF